MHEADDLQFVELGRFPAQRGVVSSATGRTTRSVALPPGPDRQEAAEAALAELVELWRLPQFRARRWLAAAGEVLHGSTPLELYVQLDRATNIVTVELWAYGRIVFGIDDWLGV